MKIISSNLKGLSVRNLAGNEAEVVIYSAIGEDYWGDGNMVSAKAFSEELKKIPDTVKTINVRINSPGGDVFQGIAIYNRLKQHKAKKVVHIDGLAASIASIIALAGDEIVIGEGALYMIHLPWTFAMGNRTDLDNSINRLMDVEEQMLGIYAKRTGLDRNEIRSMLENETWMSADEAIEKGFVHKQAEETMAIAASVFKSPWMSGKRPEKFVSETMAVNQKISSLKEKLSARLAR